MQAGPFLDRSVTPPPPAPGARRIMVKSAGLVVRRYGALDADGVIEGALDPVVSLVPMTATKIAYRGIYTVTVWRQILWREAAALLLLPLPFTAFLAAWYLAEPAPALLFLLVPMALLTLWAGQAVFLVRAHYARVVGARESLTIRFDRPAWRRRRFHDELLRRCGLAPGPIP